MGDYPIHGKVIKPESIDEREKLKRYPMVNNHPLDWHLVNYVSFFFYQKEAIQATIRDLLDTIGLKLFTSEIDITQTYTSFPNYAGYTPKDRERVLLIAQTNVEENGVYEYSTNTQQFSRVYDWRDVEQGTGIKITGKNLAVNLSADAANLLQVNANNELQLLISPNSHPALTKEAGTGYLLLDPVSLGSGGGGGSITDIANPDVDDVFIGGSDAVLLANTNGILAVYGGVFRTATPAPVQIICEALQSIIYIKRKHNLILANVTASNLIGTHPLRVRNNSLYSNFYDWAQSVTVLGAASINTVTPFAKRGQTIQMTVTGEGFALLSAFAANNAGIAISLLNFIDRFNVVIEVTCDNTVMSGAYNLVCINAYGGNSFDSGTSGNNKLIVSGAPLITALLEQTGLTVQRPEVGSGQYATFILKGFDFMNTNTNIQVPISLESYSINDNETITLEVYGGAWGMSVYGKYDISVINTITYEDSGTSGNHIIGLNFSYDRFTDKAPSQFLPYGGTGDINDWVVSINANGRTDISKTGGSGWCYFEFTDSWFAKSVIDDSYGALLSFLEANIATLAEDLGEDGEVFVALAPAGLNLTVTDLPNVAAQYIKFEKNKNTAYPTNQYAVEYKGVFNPNGYGYYIGDYQKFALHLKASEANYDQTIIRPKAGYNATQYDPNNSNWFAIWVSQWLPNGEVSFFGSNNPKLSVYVGMNGNFAITDLYLRGRVGS